MFPSCRNVLLGSLALALLAACGSSSRTIDSGPPVATGTGTGTGGMTSAPVMPSPGFSGAAGITGAHNEVVATASIAGTVSAVTGSSQLVSIAFNADDDRLITGFGISGGSAALPAGWTGPGSFSCAAVGYGSGCVMNLTYAPKTVGSGSLTIDYVFIDNAGLPRTGNALTIPYVATAHNNVVASATPTGQVNATVGKGMQSVNVNFRTDDGNAITALVVSTDLTALPAGWAGPAAGVTCAIVSTGNGCELPLTYSPTAPGRGVLVIDYGYVDDMGAAQTGSLNIPYSSTATGTVVATASPSSQVTAAQKSGGQSVAVTFTSDDGKAAANLVLTSDLGALPAGWSSDVKGFTCASVSAGNGCQLRLTYAPSALTSGTLALTYAYRDSAGAAQSGALDLAFAATTDDNVVGTESPASQIVAVVGEGTQAVSVTFTTDDSRQATALTMTTDLTALPAGWSSSVPAFACTDFSAGTDCQLQLTYAPPSAAAGTLNLGFTYRNNAGQPKTGMVNIAYRATTDNNVGATAVPSVLALRTGNSAVANITFMTDDPNPATALAITAGLATLPAGWSAASSAFSCDTVTAGSACVLPLTFSPTVATAGAVTLNYSYLNNAGFARAGTAVVSFTATTPHLFVTNAGGAISSCPLNAADSVSSCMSTGTGFDMPAGIAARGMHVYVTNSHGNSISLCSFDSGGSITGCQTTGGTLASPTSITIGPDGNHAYVYQAAGLDVCSIAADGTLTSCTVVNSSLNPLNGIALAPSGTQAYAVQTVADPMNPMSVINVLDLCGVTADGSLTGCAATGTNTSRVLATLTVSSGFVYASTTDGALDVCPVHADGGIGACVSTAAGSNANGVTFFDGRAFLSSGDSSVTSCAVSPADGTLGGCAAIGAAFSGSAGVLVRPQ